MGNQQSSTIPPSLTEKNIGDQSGKVFLITGSTSGIGRELAQILFSANAKVWIVARSESKAQAVIKTIQNAAPTSLGQLEYLRADFNDLTTIKPAVEEFLKKETRLDVLWNNAGIMIPPQGTKTVQGYEAQLGVNVIAPFVLTSLLTDILVRTAKEFSTQGTRVVWVSSSAAARFAPQGGVDLDSLSAKNKYTQWQNYGMSKAGNILISSEFGLQHASDGILSVAVDPGNLDTELYKHMPKWQHLLAKGLALKPAIYGAYTELYAGFSKTIIPQDSVAWVVPWGKVAIPRKDIAEACQPESQGGPGTARKLWEWCEKEARIYQ
ncbi:short-chain dehydrogenase [Xylariales sp. PMI_506]|nr:short-chain dehydrogenase [Xylariales sp. PMI_506]